MSTATATAQSTKVVTGKVRFSYANVFEPRAAREGQEPKYSVCLLIPKSDTQTVAKIRKAIDAAIELGLPKWGGKKPPNLKLPLRDGDTERDTDEQPEYAGHWFVNANSKLAPGIIDAQKQPILDTTEFYSGCYGLASVNFYAYNQEGAKGIACGLNNLMKLHDGEPLGGRSRAEDDFADVSAEAYGVGGDEDDFLN